jgi:hypothetical protein
MRRNPQLTADGVEGVRGFRRCIAGLQECFEDQVSVSLTNPAVNVPRTSHSLAPRSQEAEEAWV